MQLLEQDFNYNKKAQDENVQHLLAESMIFTAMQP